MARVEREGVWTTSISLAVAGVALGLQWLVGLGWGFWVMIAFAAVILVAGWAWGRIAWLRRLRTRSPLYLQQDSSQTATASKADDSRDAGNENWQIVPPSQALTQSPRRAWINSGLDALASPLVGLTKAKQSQQTSEWIGRWLLVRGKVQQVDLDERRGYLVSGTPYISLVARENYVVMCYFSVEDHDTLVDISADETVAICGVLQDLDEAGASLKHSEVVRVIESNGDASSTDNNARPAVPDVDGGDAATAKTADNQTDTDTPVRAPDYSRPNLFIAPNENWSQKATVRVENRGAGASFYCHLDYREAGGRKIHGSWSGHSSKICYLTHGEMADIYIAHKAVGTDYHSVALKQVEMPLQLVTFIPPQDYAFSCIPFRLEIVRSNPEVRAGDELPVTDLVLEIEDWSDRVRVVPRADGGDLSNVRRLDE